MQMTDKLQHAELRIAALETWLQWCLDNCDNSPEFNFGTIATQKMRALLRDKTASMVDMSRTKKGNDMHLTDKQYNRLMELVRDAYESSTMVLAGFGHIFQGGDDPLPATEKDVTEFIRRRTDLYRKTWQMAPLREALQILNGEWSG